MPPIMSFNSFLVMLFYHLSVHINIFHDFSLSEQFWLHRKANACRAIFHLKENHRNSSLVLKTTYLYMKIKRTIGVTGNNSRWWWFQKCTAWFWNFDNRSFNFLSKLSRLNLSNQVKSVIFFLRFHWLQKMIIQSNFR